VQDAYRIFVIMWPRRKMPPERVDEIARGRVWMAATPSWGWWIHWAPAGRDSAAANRAGLMTDSGSTAWSRTVLPERLLRQYSVRLLGNLARIGVRFPAQRDSPANQALALLKSLAFAEASTIARPALSLRMRRSLRHSGCRCNGQ
jgi:hypothetical protein